MVLTATSGTKPIIDNETAEDGQKRGVSMEKSTAVTNNKGPTAYHYLIKTQY